MMPRRRSGLCFGSSVAAGEAVGVVGVRLRSIEVCGGSVVDGAAVVLDGPDVVEDALEDVVEALDEDGVGRAIAGILYVEPSMTTEEGMLTVERDEISG